MESQIMDLKPYVPQLSLGERDRRWRAAGERMAAKAIDCLIVWGNTISQGLGMTNVRYLTQVGSWHGGVALFPHHGEVTLFSAPRHMSVPYNGYVAAQDWIQDLRPYSMKSIIEEIKARGFERGRIGVVSYGNVVAGNNLTYHDYLALQAGLPDAIFTDESEMIEELRRVKSAEEISMLEISGGIARKVVDTMIETAAPGVGENELYAAMIRTQLVEGAEPNIFILMSSGPIEGSETMRRRLIHGNDQPLCPTRRKLEWGDIVICEFHVSYAGYLSAVEFTVVVGEPPKELRELHAVAVECLNAAVEKFRPGATVRDIATAMRAPVINRGLDYLELGFHNHGLSSADFPTIVYKPGWGRMAFDDMADFALDENMIFGTNIDIHNPRWKTDVGVMFGDTVQVTSSGGRRLVGIPLDLPVN
ncbi:MAG TPA: Xaa-Pro peptidase family protein [Candidatus Binatia bacterium]|nr:Xaa-Pro peptidase family protein [Candidatus Binatia bacterium]